MGRIEVFEEQLTQLNRKRYIRVYLPDSYDANPNQYFPVVYMHDGGNLYKDEEAGFGVSWQVKATLENFEKTKEIKDLIIVGIDNDGEVRWEEYSPWKFSCKDGFKQYKIDGRGGQGEQYGEYIVKSLKPLIDKKYRTLPERKYTAIAGSSMGGFISLYIGMKYSDVFSCIGAFSTASWFAEPELLKFIEETVIEDQYFYIDTGTHECMEESYNYYLEGAKKIHDALCKKGISQEFINFLIDEGGVHHEKDWAKRFPQFIKWVAEKF